MQLLKLQTWMSCTQQHADCSLHFLHYSLPALSGGLYLLLLPITTKLLPSGPEADPQVLHAHLQARPIWTQSSLAQQLPEVAQPDLESQLQKFCYQFQDGTAICADASLHACQVSHYGFASVVASKQCDNKISMQNYQ